MKKKDVLLMAGGMLVSFVTGKALGGCALLNETNKALKEHGLEITSATIGTFKNSANVIVQKLTKEEA